MLLHNCGLVAAKFSGLLLLGSRSFFLCFFKLFMFSSKFIVIFIQVKEEPKPHSLGKSIWELITNPKIFVFILACIVVGTCTGLLWQFLFWYVHSFTLYAFSMHNFNVDGRYTEDIASCENMKYIKILQGLISIVQCFGGELPFFYISSMSSNSDKILKSPHSSSII